MAEMVQIRSVKEYFNEFGVNGIGKGGRRDLVRAQITDEFRREVFAQLMFKFKVADVNAIPDNSKTRQYADNIMKNTRKKWFALQKLFNQYVETKDLLVGELKLFEDPDIDEDDAVLLDEEDAEDVAEGDEDSEEGDIPEDEEEDGRAEETDCAVAAETDEAEAADTSGGIDDGNEGGEE